MLYLYCFVIDWMVCENSEYGTPNTSFGYRGASDLDENRLIPLHFLCLLARVCFELLV